MRLTRSATATACSGVSALSTPWLPDNEVGLITHGSPTALDHRRHLRRPRARGQGCEGRLGHLEGGEPDPHGELVARRGDGVGGVVAQAQPCRCLRRHHGAHVVDGDHGVEGREVVLGHDGGGPRLGIGEGDLQRARAHQPTQGAGLLGAHHHLDTQGPGGIEEISGPVRRRGNEKEYPGHPPMMAGGG